jgi:hypothetical protein
MSHSKRMLLAFNQELDKFKDKLLKGDFLSSYNFVLDMRRFLRHFYYISLNDFNRNNANQEHQGILRLSLLINKKFEE